MSGLTLTACGGGEDDGGGDKPSTASSNPSAPPSANAAPEGGGATAKGYVTSSAVWPQTTIPVCWVNPEPVNAASRLWARQAVERSWQAHSRLTFTGWGTCPQANESNAIRIFINDDRSWGRLGTDGLLNIYSMQLNLSFLTWGREFCQASPSRLKDCVEFTAVHEFGHALGFVHEQDRPDTPAFCRDPQINDADVMVGPWDWYSVMNYCSPNSYLSSALSEIDVRMVQQIYGARSGLSAAYFNNPNLQGTPVFQRAERIHFDWADRAPALDMPADQFSVRWSGFIDAPVNGAYSFQTRSDDGVRVWVDGQLVIDNWTGHALTIDTSAPLTLSAGRHAIRVEYQELTGMSTISLLWRVPGQPFDQVPLASLSPPAVEGIGLSAFYFGNPQLQGNPVVTRAEAVNFDWPGSPQNVPVAPDGFSVRWSGSIEVPVSGTYVLQTLSDDGIRVWIDGQLVIDNWGGHAATEDIGPARYWEAGERHAIRVEYQELGGAGTAQLRWLTPFNGRYTAVPQSALSTH